MTEASAQKSLVDKSRDNQEIMGNGLESSALRSAQAQDQLTADVASGMVAGPVGTAVAE